MRTRRPWYLLMLGAVAGPLVLASAAWACANLATLTLDTSSAAAGDTVTFTGSRYRETGPAIDGKAQEVVLHWNARNGQVLTTAAADSSRNISGQFNVPNVAPGNYVVVATQLGANGVDPVAGTPGRFSISVVASGASSANFSDGAPIAAPESAPAPQQSAVVAPEQSSVPAPQQSSVAAPEQSSAPAPQQSAVAAPEQSSAPAPQQSSVAAPEQSSAPAPAPAAPEAVAPATSGPAAPVALDSSPVASRTTMVTPASSGSSLLPLALVGVGLVLSLVSSALVMANRRSYSPARAAR